MIDLPKTLWVESDPDSDHLWCEDKAAVDSEEHPAVEYVRADEIERLKDDAIHNEGVMVALREGYTKAKARVEELENVST